MALNKSKVLLDLFPRIPEKFGGLSGVFRCLHAIENGRAGDRKIVKVVLKVSITFKPEGLYNADDCCGCGSEPAAHGSHIQQNELARVFENRSDDALMSIA